MRRWNSWGFTGIEYPISSTIRRELIAQIGQGKSLPEATLQEVIAKVPESRLPVPLNRFITTNPETRIRYSCGQSVPDWIAMRSGKFPAFPDGVAFPETSAHVRELLDWAQTHQIKIIPYGGGTSVVGHVTVQPMERPVLTISLEHLNSFLEFDKISQLARFGAGICGPDLEAQLFRLGFILGHYPQSFELSTLGGWIASRSKGQESQRYGGIENLFVGGRIETFAGSLEIPPSPSSAAGPDLREIVLGSEGRFGIITEAVVRISPKPDIEQYYGCFFPDWNAGIETLRELTQSGLGFSLLRLSNAKETDIQLKLSGSPLLVWGLEAWLKLNKIREGKCLLLIGFTGTKSEVKYAKAHAFHLIKRRRGVVTGRAIGEKWKKHRFYTAYLRESLWRLGYIVDTLETACNWSEIDALVGRIESKLEQALHHENERVLAFSHLSHTYAQGSSIYTTYLFRQGKTPEESLSRWKQLKKAASQAIVSAGCTITHQHGIGIDHKPYLEAEKGAVGMGALRTLCNYFDPQHLLNPGKLIDEEQ